MRGMILTVLLFVCLTNSSFGQVCYSRARAEAIYQAYLRQQRANYYLALIRQRNAVAYQLYLRRVAASQSQGSQPAPTYSPPRKIPGPAEVEQ